MIPQHRAALAAGAALAIASGAVESATAGSINVPGDFASIQDAIDAAGSGDVILVADGTWSWIDLAGKSVVVRATAGPDVTFIDAAGAGRAIQADSGEGPGTVVQGFTITGGDAFSGGGLFAESSSPTIIGCIFTVNDASVGGAVYVSGGAPTLSACTFVDNTASNGAGVYVTDGGAPLITTCRFEGNDVLGKGGAVYISEASATIAGSTFIDNGAGTGAAIWINGGGPFITSCRFLGNTALQNAGAVWFQNSNPRFANCLFSGNVAISGSGGAINAQTSGAEITNCTLYGNTAGFNGGGLFNSNGVPRLTNCILWANGPDQIVDAFGFVADVTYSDVEGIPVWPGVANINDDPGFPDPAGPDGTLGTEDDDLRPPLGSPVIDIGDDTALPPEIVVDLDGNPRFEGVTIDLGPYERQPTVPQCPGDIDGSGAVDFQDLLLLLAAWGPCAACPEDIDGSGTVDFQDLLAVLAAWGPCP